MITFPRTRVELRMEGRNPLVSSPNLAILYNNGQSYTRHVVGPNGDKCEWFAFMPRTFVDAMRSYKPGIEEYDPQLFDLNCVFLSKELFLLQRVLVEHISQPVVDQWWVDEASLRILDGLCHTHAELTGKESSTVRNETRNAHRELAREAQRLLVERYDQHVTLESISAELHTSPFHLARIFRQQLGLTLHRYLEQLRLRMAVERLPDYAHNLTHLALEVGYTSHSHFSQAFRRVFGLPPSRMSYQAALEQLQPRAVI